MTELSEHLKSLGLSQYLETFISEGFDTWETLLDITESDLYDSSHLRFNPNAYSWKTASISMSNSGIAEYVYKPRSTVS